MRHIRPIIASALFTVLLLPAAGCNKKDKDGTSNPDEAAEAEGDPLAELQAIPDEIQAEIDLVLQPITDVDVVIDQVTSIPTRYNLDVKSLTGMAKASLDNGSVSLEADLDSVVKIDADIKAMVSEAKQTVMSVPAKGTEAMAKLTAAFAGSASAG